MYDILSKQPLVVTIHTHTQTEEVYKTWERCKYSFLLQHIPFSFKTSYSLSVLADYRIYLLDEPHVCPGNLHPEHGIASSPAFIPKSPHSLQAVEVCRDGVSVFKEKFIRTVLGTVRNMAALWKRYHLSFHSPLQLKAEVRKTSYGNAMLWLRVLAEARYKPCGAKILYTLCFRWALEVFNSMMNGCSLAECHSTSRVSSKGIQECRAFSS